MTPRRAILLFGHGSRDPLWRLPMDAVAARVRALDPAADVQCAFLELQAPDLLTAAADAVARGAGALTLLPMFLGTGRHARHDLPVLMEQLRAQHPQVQLELLPSVGEDPRVVDLLARISLHNA